MNNLPPPRRMPVRPPPKIVKSVANGLQAIGIQDDMFGKAANLGNQYTAAIKAPIYEPKNSKPNVIKLVNTGKTSELLKAIYESNVTDDEKRFLVLAAYRHNVFHYGLIADYYAHATQEMQRLMERSALVIIDFADAIRLGFVKYTEDIADLYAKEHDGKKS